MSFKRTAAIASAFTLIAVIGVLYISFGGEQQAPSNANHNLMTHQASNPIQASKCYFVCSKKRKEDRKACSDDCKAIYGLYEAQPVADAHQAASPA